MKKKIIAVVLCFLMLTCSMAILSACNNKSNDPNNSSTEQYQGGGDNSDSTENSGNTDDSGNSDGSEDTNGGDDTNNNNPSPDGTATDGVFTYTLNEDKNSYTVSIFSRDIVSKYDSEEEFFADYEDILSRKEITIPSEYKRTPVTAIGEFAFIYMGIESITIPDTITTIGMGAFRGCIQLKSIDFSSNLKTIGYGAFASCYKLTKVVLPEGLTTIEDEAFYSCPSLISITIPSTLTTFEDNFVFYDCRKLIEIINLSNVDIADIIKTTDHSNSEALEIHTGESKLVESGDYLFYTTTGKNWLMAYTGDDVNITLPGSYNGRNYYVHPYAFFELNDKLLSITMENDENAVIALDDNAFAYCRIMKTVSISNNVLSIGTDIFEGCEQLTSVSVDSGNESYSSTGNCLVWKDRKMLLKGFNDSVIPNDGSVEIIYYDAFYGCEEITQVVIPEGVTTIGSRAFYGCTSLQQVVIPSTIQTIGEDAFANTNISYNRYDNGNYLGNENNPYIVLVCPAETEITSCIIHDDTQIVVRGAFEECTKIKSLTVPFIGASKIQSEDAETGYLGYIFGAYDYRSQQDYVPSSLKTVILTNSSCIEAFAFYECSNIENVTIPNTVSKIGSYAFGSCTGITSIVVPKSVESIGNNTFSGCTSLISITVPFVGGRADNFSGDEFSYIFDSSGGSVPDSITTVVITGGTLIEDWAFSDCKNLESVTIASSIIEIGSHAFDGCDKLKYAIFEETTGWACYFINKDNDLSSADLSDAETAALFLRDTYSGKTWKR